MKVLTCRVWILIKKVEISPMRASKSRCPRTFALPCKVTYDIVEIASKLIWLHLHFEWTKVSKNALKSLIWKPEACSKRVLPDRSILI